LTRVIDFSDGGRYLSAIRPSQGRQSTARATPGGRGENNNLERRMKRPILLTAVLLAAVAAPVRAELYTREQAIDFALEHNPELRALRERLTAADQRREAASGARLPQVGLSLSARTSNNALDAFADKLNTRSVTAQDFDPARLNEPGYSELYMGLLGLRWPVYTGGRVSAQIEGAAEMAKATRLQYERARELTAHHTLRAYLNVQLAERGLVIAEDAVESAAEHARTTAGLVREGRIVTSDRLTAEVNLAAMESGRAQARARVERARNQLRLVMGLSSAITPAVTPSVAAELALPAELARLEDLEVAALATRRDMAAARAMQAAAQANVEAARAAHLPQIDVIASHNRFATGDASDYSNSVMGVLALDLYSGGRPSAEVAAAAAEAKQAQWQTQAQEHAVRNDVRDAVEALREAHERHGIAAGNVERARETVRQVKLRYGQGRTILIDLLQAERALVEARNEELNARFNLETGQAALDLAQGALKLPTGDAP
jgi:outer membrane protein TolC